MKRLLFLIFLLVTKLTYSKVYIDSTYVEKEIILETKTGKIYGSLCLPNKQKNTSIALIISGSGPTDRDGNNVSMKNNSLQFLAHELAKKGIASVRYDKRGIGKSVIENLKEENVRFEDFVNDASSWVELLKKDKRFSEVIIIGHSEGSLIGMIASKKTKAEMFVSISGPGDSADKILKKQLALQPDYIKNMTYPIIDSLKSGKIVADVNPMLNSLFRKDIQPYLISLFNYDPQVEIKKLDIPILIINGTKDLQVSETEALKLKQAQPKADLKIIDNMNHVLKIVEVNGVGNLESYNNPDIPISPELIKSVSDFIVLN